MTFHSPQALEVEPELVPFARPTAGHNEISILLREDYDAAPRPRGPMAGSDLLLETYFQDGSILCLAKGGPKGPIAITQWDGRGRTLVCYRNPAYCGTGQSVGLLLRLLPLRSVLQKEGVLFFHASQAVCQGRGILFTAPSGTGKTTQANLWRTYRGAEVVCNDRTLIYGGKTYGYPLDGSQPVGSGAVHDLGAVVLLRQGQENRVRNLRPGQAMAGLMPQLVLDGWNPEARALACMQLGELIGGYPVYELECTPDEGAVACLEQRLKKDGVLQ